MPSYPLRTIAEQIGGELIGNAEETATGVNALEAAQPGELTFAEYEKYLPRVRATRAVAVIVSKEFPAVPNKNLLRVEHPRQAFVKAMVLFRPQRMGPEGIHPTAVISSKAALAADVVVGEQVVIREGARIGQGTVIESGVHVGQQVAIGQHCWIGPNVVLMHGIRLGDRVMIHGGSVIGGDGFGYVWAEGRHLKIPQLGTVIIEDDVELGCNVCVDRATFGSTIIRRGTKIDNLVQIAHNDVIGEHVILAGQVGLAGSVTIGNRVILAGQVGVPDHVIIEDDVKAGGGTIFVGGTVRSGQTMWGYPARPLQEAKKEFASLAFLPKLLEQVRKLRIQVAQLEARLSSGNRPRADSPSSAT